MSQAGLEPPGRVGIVPGWDLINYSMIPYKTLLFPGPDSIPAPQEEFGEFLGGLSSTSGSFPQDSSHGINGIFCLLLAHLRRVFPSHPSGNSVEPPGMFCSSRSADLEVFCVEKQDGRGWNVLIHERREFPGSARPFPSSGAIPKSRTNLEPAGRELGRDPRVGNSVSRSCQERSGLCPRLLPEAPHGKSPGETREKPGINSA